MTSGVQINRIAFVAKASAIPHASEVAADLIDKLGATAKDSYARVTATELELLQQDYLARPTPHSKDAVKLIDLLLRKSRPEAASEARSLGTGSVDAGSNEVSPERLTRERILEIISVSRGKAQPRVESGPPRTAEKVLAERLRALAPLLSTGVESIVAPSAEKILEDYENRLAKAPLAKPLFELAAALEAAGMPTCLRRNRSSEQTAARILGALGPCTLPLLLGPDYALPRYLADVVAGWELSGDDVELIAKMAASNADASLREKVLTGLLRNRSLPEAQKLRVFVALTMPGAALPVSAPLLAGRPVDPSALVKAALDGEASTARMCLAVALDAGLFGLGELGPEKLRSATDRLLADSDPAVRLLAARLFWRASDVSIEAQKRLLSSFKDCDRDAVFDRISEAEDLTRGAFAPRRVREKLDRTPEEDLRVPLLESLLGNAPANVDATPLLETLVTELGDRWGIIPLAGKTLLAGPYAAAEKAALIERLFGCAQYTEVDELLEQVVPFLLSDPETASSMPKVVREISSRACRQAGKMVLDRDEIAERLSDPKTMPDAVLEILETTASPLFARPFMQYSRGLRQQVQDSLILSLRATAQAEYWTAGAVRVASEAEVDTDELTDALLTLRGGGVPGELTCEWLKAAEVFCRDPRLTREQLLCVLSVVAQARGPVLSYVEESREVYASLIPHFLDPRLEIEDSAELIDTVLGDHAPEIAELALSRLERLRLPREVVRTLNCTHKLQLQSPATVASAGLGPGLVRKGRRTDRVDLLAQALALMPPPAGSLLDTVQEYLGREAPRIRETQPPESGPRAKRAQSILEELPSAGQEKLARRLADRDFCWGLAELQSTESPRVVEEMTAALEPLTANAGLPRSDVRQLLLTLVVSCCPDRRDGLDRVDRELKATRSTLRLLCYALASRNDWTPAERVELEKAGHLLIAGASAVAELL